MKLTDKHPKHDFQVERLAFFSDAVFAIVITLLAIEFKVPHITKTSTLTDIVEQLLDLKYHFLSLLFTYLLISNFWIKHHFLFKHLHSYNKQIVIVNLVCLFPILFLPFTTSFVAETIDSDNLGIIIIGLKLYVLNITIAYILTYLFYWLCFVKYKELTFSINRREKIIFVSETLHTSIVSSLALLLTLFTDNYFIYLGIFFVGVLVIPLIKWYNLKKAA